MTTPRLDGKAYLVTGGSMGIGLACAEEIVSRGARVVVMARSVAELEQATRKLNDATPKSAIAFHGDVTSESSVDRALNEVVQRFGTIDGVVHSAGVYGPIGSVTQVDPTEWFDAIRINLLGTFLVARGVARRLMELERPGSIVLMSGGGAATPFPNYTAYACGKVGVVRLTETMAAEMSDTAVRVNCIAPGFVLTRLHQQTLEAGVERAGPFLKTTKDQLEKGGVPATVAARAAAFLLSDEAAGITGRFLAAPYDDYASWPAHQAELAGSDLFTLRRIVPRDRGKNWQ